MGSSIKVRAMVGDWIEWVTSKNSSKEIHVKNSLCLESSDETHVYLDASGKVCILQPTKDGPDVVRLSKDQAVKAAKFILEVLCTDDPQG